VELEWQQVCEGSRRPSASTDAVTRSPLASPHAAQIQWPVIPGCGSTLSSCTRRQQRQQSGTATKVPTLRRWRAR
jgi:hypothetical protein